jgi:hypothetical protein
VLWFAGADEEDDGGVASEVCDRVVFGGVDAWEPPLDAASSWVASFSCVEEDAEGEESWSWLLELDE